MGVRVTPPGRASSRFEEHVGELKLAIEADTLPELFAEAARFVSRQCGPVGDPAGDWEPVSLSARDVGTLLVDWLNELIGRSEIENRAYGDVWILRLAEGHPDLEVGVEPPAGRPEAEIHPEAEHRTGAEVHLDAELRGRPVRSWESPLKAATYHGLRLEREGERWQAVVLLDV